MTRTLIGVDSQGVPCVKITKGSIDPVSEPDTNVGSFLYNSKWAADLKAVGFKIAQYLSGTGIYYEPSGATSANYTRATFRISTSSNPTIFRRTAFPDFPYDLPLFDVKIKERSTGRFVGERRRMTVSDFGNREAYSYSTAGARAAWHLNLGPQPAPEFGTPGNSVYFEARVQSLDGDLYDKTIVAWRLPGNNVSIIDGTPLAPVPGQRSIEINSSACRVAKPGFDVRTATETQLAFDTSNRPVKIIAADDIALPVGTTSYNLGLSVPADTICDVIFYDGGTVTFPQNPRDAILGADYWISGNTLNFDNAGVACRARFIVVAFDDTPPTSGANDVLRQFAAGGENVAQFLRPGAGNNPSFADIILDSRWPCLQILAEGYLPVASRSNVGYGNFNAGQSYPISFNGTGIFPFVKYTTVHLSGGEKVKPPLARTNKSAFGGIVYQGGDSSYCEISGGTATFWTFRGNPIEERYTDSNGWFFEYDDDPIVGIRYYILGIPTP